MLANGGRWYHATEDGRAANIARDDLARAAATVLAGTQEGRTTYTLSGGEALTTAETAAQLSAALGRPITPVPVPAPGLVQGMVGAGLPEPVAQVFASFDVNTAAGHVGTVTDDYRRITGRAPMRFADWLSANRARLPGL
jgi:NAD(P)H dehydrogenase (quinone)